MQPAIIAHATYTPARSRARLLLVCRHRPASRPRSTAPDSPLRRHKVLSTVACAQPHSSSPSGHGSRSASGSLQLPGTAAITLFGVRHAEEDAGIGEAILGQRPAAVVVETAMTAGHGEAMGTVLRPDDQATAQELQRDLRARIICQFGRRLRDTASPVDDPIWQVLTATRG